MRLPVSSKDTPRSSRDLNLSLSDSRAHAPIPKGRGSWTRHHGHYFSRPELTTHSPDWLCGWASGQRSTVPDKTLQHMPYLFCNRPLPFESPPPTPPAIFSFLIFPVCITRLNDQSTVFIFMLQQASALPVQGVAVALGDLCHKAQETLVAPRQSAKVAPQGESVGEGPAPSAIQWLPAGSVI